ncbi:MAG TPA: sulfatase-like hydrolase/transferase, partial [Candidatus Bathyarchaeia archaeon]|nr:sulfatase-like hydrolase/transferase [Candidatus Bathyarchaeia archaeon]
MTYLLKISLPASVLWFFFETVENATLFYNFFPRGGFFKMAFDGVVLKFLLLPGLMLVLGTFAIYFLFVFAAAWLSLSVAVRLFPKKEQGVGLTLFHAANVYLAMYLIASLNAFLMPQSLARHPFLYSLVFPQRAVTVEMPASAFFYWLHDGAFVYWHLLLFAFVVGSVRPASRFLKTRPRLFISLMGIVCLIISAGVGARFLANAKNKEPFRQQGHVIFIGLDSFQYNQMSPQWGSFDVPAPDVLRFVQEGTSFTSAWTAFARTYPSYISLLTGRYPASTGIRDNLVEDHNERPGNIYLGDVLKANGYYRFYATDDVRFSNIRSRHGFDEIFTPEKNVAGFLLTSFYDYALGNLLMYHDALPWLFQPVINNRAATAYHPQAF